MVGIGSAPGAELRMHRRVGAAYAGIGALLLLLGLVIPVSWLLSGQPVYALVCGVVLLVLGVGFLRLALPMLRTELHADAAGVRGRTPEGQVVDLPWAEVSIDGEEDRLRLQVGPEVLDLSAAGWDGFGGFVELVVATPAAADRLTADGWTTLVRLMGGGPQQTEEPPAA